MDTVEREGERGGGSAHKGSGYEGKGESMLEERNRLNHDVV